MKIFNNLEDIDIENPTVVALGNFDGVHLGHQKLIKNAVDFAKLQELKSAVFTFSNHPKNFKGKKEVKGIIDFQEKCRILESLNVDYLFNIAFDPYIRKLSSVEFVDEILINKFKIRQAYCGFNYRYGYRASGNPEKLLHYGIEKGFGLHILEPFTIDGIVVSSTEIRSAIAGGNIKLANKYLGRPYAFNGKVISGSRLGRTIGFPTANLAMDDSMVLPLSGVYVSRTTVDGKVYKSISNIGKKPTVGGSEKNLETHIFDFSDDLYGKTIRVEFLDFMRKEERFSGVEELKKVIERDSAKARNYKEENYEKGI